MWNFTFGTMNKLVFIGLLFLCYSCSNDASESADEQERPADWKSSFELVVALDSTNDEFVDLHIVSSKQSESLSVLIDQAYDLAFSGDADVFGTTLFGEVDQENQLEPKKLLESLEFFDTVYVEDLITGELKDTVVDLSFNKSAVTLLTILFSISDDHSIDMKPTLLSMGKQVFNEETGQLRGFSDKFFVAVNDGVEIDTENYDKMIISSDSLGQFNISSFMIYNEETTKGLGEIISDRHGVHEFYEMNFSLEFDYSKAELTLKNLTISPADEPKLI